MIPIHHKDNTRILATGYQCSQSMSSDNSLFEHNLEISRGGTCITCGKCAGTPGWSFPPCGSRRAHMQKPHQERTWLSWQPRKQLCSEGRMRDKSETMTGKYDVRDGIDGDKER